ncbi:hypothetical protein [Maritalea sp.]|uniref:hypothetical protein n=1 Tax=Maritalea sp. TaxID=2003361 RepID=UPI0039E2546A
MISILRTRAEERFAAIERTKKVTLSERQEKEMKTSENTARLKALRLAKETQERTKNKK